MSKLTRDDVLKLARLARLKINEDEIQSYIEELSAILGYVEQLQHAHVAGLEPTSQVSGLTNAMREDSVRDYGVSRDDLLRLAPSTQDGQLKVKRMIG